MIFDLKNSNELNIFKSKVIKATSSKSIVDFKIKNKSRTLLQNRSLHLYFTMIADQLNEVGIEYEYKGLKGLMLTTRYTGNIVKDFLWRPIQFQLFGIESTTDINTQQINEIIDIITLAMAHLGVVIPFPNYESWLESTHVKNQ